MPAPERGLQSTAGLAWGGALHFPVSLGLRKKCEAHLDALRID
jgi:hypothetical protein